MAASTPNVIWDDEAETVPQVIWDDEQPEKQASADSELNRVTSLSPQSKSQTQPLPQPKLPSFGSTPEKPLTPAEIEFNRSVAPESEFHLRPTPRRQFRRTAF